MFSEGKGFGGTWGSEISLVTLLRSPIVYTATVVACLVVWQEGRLCPRPSLFGPLRGKYTVPKSRAEMLVDPLEPVQ